MQPYASLAVRKLTRTLAIGKRDGGFEPVRDERAVGWRTTPTPCLNSNHFEPVRDERAAGWRTNPNPYLNSNQVGDDLLGGCTGTWVEDWDKFERTVNLDHVLLYP